MVTINPTVNLALEALRLVARRRGGPVGVVTDEKTPAAVLEGAVQGERLAAR